MSIEQVTIDNISEIFDLAQNSSACHLKYALMLKDAIEKNQDEKLINQVYLCLQQAFLIDHGKRNLYVDRIINFMSTFATSFKIKTEAEGSVEIHPVLKDILKFTLELSESISESSRYWSCVLIKKIFQNLEEITEELYDEIKQTILKRLQDPKAVIRIQAIITLHYLQDPTDKEDSIVQHFCTLANSDFNAKVRQLCIEKLALNKFVLPIMLARISDTDWNVRLTSFQKLQSIPKYLKVAQRRLVLQCGFYDSSEKIRNFISTTFLNSWLEKYDGNYLELMKSVRFDACEKDIKITTRLIELMLNALFKSTTVSNIIQYIKVNEEKLIDYKDINWESMLYYRIAVQFLRQMNEAEESLNTILPELVYFCKNVKGYCEFMQNSDFDKLEFEFTIQQFLMITRDYDVSDTSSRQALTALVHYLLQNHPLSSDTTEVIIFNLEKTITNIDNRSIFICEIISNIMHGEDETDYEELKKKEEERHLAMSQLESEIILLTEEEQHFIQVEKNFTEAKRVKEEIEQKKFLLRELKTVKNEPAEIEKKTDVFTMLKCLSIAEGLLRSPTVVKFNPAIATLHSEVLSPALLHEDDRVKIKALGCYARCCIIDYRTARYGIHLFSGLLFKTDVNDTRPLIIGLQASVDILTAYGLSLIENCEEGEVRSSQGEEERKVFVGGTSLTDLIQSLADHMEHEDYEVQDVATHGVCVLLLHSSVTSSSLLSRIILKWAHPCSEDRPLKQFIGWTLNELTKLPNCLRYFPDAVIMTVRTLVRAPSSNPLADIDIDNVIKFMVVLCQMPSQGSEIHLELALKICQQMLEKPKGTVNFFLSKVLTQLNITSGNSLDELVTMCDELRNVTRNNQILKNINKFNTALTKSAVKEKCIRTMSIKEDPDE